MGRSNSAKEDMPSPREYRSLKRSAEEKVTNPRKDDQEFRLECTFVLRLMGELGLRAGEVVHLTEDWVDFSQNEIHIPEYDRCDFGEDGGPCGYCKKQARQRARKNEEISYEVALRERWSPKGDFAVRDIWFGWDPTLVDTIDEYLLKYGHYPHSRASINRRINTIAEESELVETNDVYPHALRGYAAKYHATKGMRAFQLKEMMGWSEVDGAMDYIKMASNDVKSELKRIHRDPRR